MNKILRSIALMTALVGGPASLHAADPPSLNENLKAFKPYLGNWSMHWTENGQPMTGKATVMPDARGNIVTLRTEVVDKEGKPVFSGVAVFYWQTETKSLAEVHFFSNGSHGSNILVSQTDEKLVLQGQRFSADGKPSWGSTEMIRLDEDNWTGQFVRISYQGASVPDSPKYNFTRAK